MTRRGALAWAAAVIPLWIVMILCTHWEPVQRDGWGHFLFHRNIGLSPRSLVDFAIGTYEHNNPRLGQVLTLLVYTPGPWHSIVTPVIELGTFVLATVLVLGRRPSLRRADDALVFATIAGMVLVTAPLVGPMLFYRPYTGNYLFGLAINLLFLVPYRLEYERPHRRSRKWVPLMLLLGLASGLCNEHTGPAIVGLAAAATYAVWQRGERVGGWAFAGIAGMIAGGVLLYVAPGQAIRYNGLAAHASLLGRIAGRGFVGNAAVFWRLFVAVSPTLVWAVLGVVARRTRREAQPRPLGGRPEMQTRSELALLAGAIAIVITLLVSPKLGGRLYFASIVLVDAAIAGWVVAQLAGPRTRVVAWVLALGAIVFASVQCVRAYAVLGPEFRERLAILQHAPPNSVADLPRYTVKGSRWAFPDDLETEPLRSSVSGSFTLALIRMTGPGAGSGSAVADEP